MTNEQLAYEIARGIGQTGVEGHYGSVSCSTAGDYPSMGISQWEGIGGRGDLLLSYIDGGNYFAGRTYSNIRRSGEMGALSELLDSQQGQEAQNMILAQDCLESYLPVLKQVPSLDDSRCFIYAGIWCPTSHYVVSKFLQNRVSRHNLRSLAVLRDLFRDQYYIAAAVGNSYAAGYANRAENTYQYAASRNLSEYGVPAYGSGPFGR
ncbi:hypothetical protein [Anaerospora hongkongensis]|uniref:hypothetical protein n=1 Tax=Anaerospora hongkongensis TaxID=244830 RepID=UPI00289FD8F8|nr:hypothetical protein [Anaerospora hongkongensis]